MASSEPIIVREDNGMWHVDHQDGNTQNFPTKGEAVEAAQKVADSEGRQVSVQ